MVCGKPVHWGFFFSFGENTVQVTMSVRESCTEDNEAIYHDDYKKTN